MQRTGVAASPPTVETRNGIPSSPRSSTAVRLRHPPGLGILARCVGLLRMETASNVHPHRSRCQQQLSAGNLGCHCGGTRPQRCRCRRRGRIRGCDRVFPGQSARHVVVADQRAAGEPPAHPCRHAGRRGDRGVAAGRTRTPDIRPPRVGVDHRQRGRIWRSSTNSRMRPRMSMPTDTRVWVTKPPHSMVPIKRCPGRTRSSPRRCA